MKLSLPNFERHFHPFKPAAVLCSLLLMLGIGLLPQMIYVLIAMVIVLYVMIRSRGLRLALLVLLASAYFAFSVYGKLVDWPIDSAKPVGYYDLQLESFKHGHLDLPITPAPGIVELRDPYRWINVAPFHPPADITYYRGHYYIYWGPGPILKFILPYHLLTGRYPSFPLECWWFATLALVFFWLAGLRWLERAQNRPCSALQELLLFCALAFCTLIGPVLRIAEIYEVAILSGLADAGVALYLIQRRQRAADIGAGLFSALILLSRPTLCFVTLAVLALRACQDSWATVRPMLRSFAFGYAPVATAALIYNFARFDDFFNFGYTYQFTLWDFHYWKWDALTTFIGSCALLFQSYTFVGDFPPLQISTFGRDWLALRYRNMNDVSVGVFVAALFVPLALYLHASQRPKKQDYAFFAVYLSALLSIVICASLAGISFRYSMEAAMLFVLAATVYLLSREPQKWSRGILFLGSLWFCVNAGLVLSLLPGRAELSAVRPALYQHLRSLLQVR